MTPLPKPLTALRRALLLLGALSLGTACEAPVGEISLPAAGGGLPIRIPLIAQADPAGVRIALDGTDVTSLFTAAGGAMTGVLPLPAPGTHQLDVDQPRAPLAGFPVQHFTSQQHFDVPAATPALASFAPAPVAGALAQTAWLRLAFASAVPPEALAGFGFGLACNGTPVARAAYRVDGDSVVIDPTPSLPSGSCRVAWRGPAGVEERTFEVAAEATSGPAGVLYQRIAPITLAPFPDDWWTVDDASTPTGLRIAFSGPTFGDARDSVLNGIATSMSDLDGYSPVGPIVLAFTHAVEDTLLPKTEAESMQPLAPVALFDADPTSPDYGARVPYNIEYRNDLAPDGTTDHTIILYPAITLRTSGRYAVVVTRRLVAKGDPSRPFARSAFFAQATGAPSPGDDAATVRVRGLVGPLLDFLEQAPAVPMPREDVALVLRVSTRSWLRDPSDLVAMKENALAAPPPVLTVTSRTSSSRRTLIVKGTLGVPDYLSSADQSVITRDATGRPQAWRIEQVPFVMTIPSQALAAPVPVVIYQHGSPGGPDEVTSTSQEFLDDAGYAILGIQDCANRRFGATAAQLTAGALLHLILHGHLPLTDLETHADLQSLVRAIPAIAAQDWLPNGAPDGRLELDPTKILYRGISFGSHHSFGFLPFAPEVTAAASIVGSGREYETYVHQIDKSLPDVRSLIPALRAVELLVGLAALENDQDRQDPYFLATHLYRERLPIAGIAPTAQPPSILLLEGIGDTYVTNNATRAVAREIGIPQVGNMRRPTVLLDHVPAPLSGNVSATRTGGEYQYEPAFTPSCVARNITEGHFCPQSALEAEMQIKQFFSTALSGAAPVIIDPLP